MTKPRMFPIQGGGGRPYGQVSWEIAELAYEHWSAYFHDGQSLQRIAERGGFSWGELRMALAKEDFLGRDKR